MKIQLYVQPSAKKSGCVGYHGELLKIKLKAQPLDGAANAELISFIAETLKLPKSAVVITAGHTSRTKTLEFEVAIPEDAVIGKIIENKC